MKLTIDNRDLAYTIDTYATASDNSFEESEIDYYREEHNLTEEETRKLEFNYDHKAIVKALANESINILSNELVGPIVKSIDFVASTSPQFYNYTTDSYTATWTFNVVKLKKYISDNKQAYTDFAREEWHTVYMNMGTKDHNENDYVLSMLDFYTRNTYSEDDYNSALYEKESEIWTNHMSLTEESQKLIDKKQEVAR